MKTGFVRAGELIRRRHLSGAAIGICIGIVAQAVNAKEPQPNEPQELVRKSVASGALGNVSRQFALLREATRIAPDDPLAHWHLGRITVDGIWVAVEEAERRAASDPRQVEYARLRADKGHSIDDQRSLARWCRKNGLEAEALYHWAAVISQRPNDDEALGAVGRKWFNGQLLTPEEIRQVRVELKAWRLAMQPWETKAAAWQRAIAGKPGMSREEALRELREVRATAAIPPLEEVTLYKPRARSAPGRGHERDLALAFVAALGNMPNHDATLSLVRHAVLSKDADVRDASIYQLKERPLHDYVPVLLSQLTPEVESSFRVINGADGSVHYLHSIYREGQDANLSMQVHRNVSHRNLVGYRIPRKAIDRLAPGYVSELVPTDDMGEFMAKATRRTALARREYIVNAMQVEQQVAAVNEMAERYNERLASVLANVTGQDFGTRPDQWWEWWNDHNEYETYGDVPEFEQYYNDTNVYTYAQPATSCFIAGTPVWTKTGQKPIETLEVGELVLSQDVETGELAYKPVVGRTERPPSPTIKFTFHEDMLHTTLGHPIWVIGHGWKMAKELEPGARLHAINGAQHVESMERAEEAEAYNLIVADWNTYFVGEQGILVHDNTPRRPVRAVAPGVPLDR